MSICYRAAEGKLSCSNIKHVFLWSTHNFSTTQTKWCCESDGAREADRQGGCWDGWRCIRFLLSQHTVGGSLPPRSLQCSFNWTKGDKITAQKALKTLNTKLVVAKLQNRSAKVFKNHFTLLLTSLCLCAVLVNFHRYISVLSGTFRMHSSSASSISPAQRLSV